MFSTRCASNTSEERYPALPADTVHAVPTQPRRQPARRSRTSKLQSAQHIRTHHADHELHRDLQVPGVTKMVPPLKRERGAGHAEQAPAPARPPRRHASESERLGDESGSSDGRSAARGAPGTRHRPSELSGLTFTGMSMQR